MGNQASETKSPLEKTKRLIASKLGIKSSSKRLKENKQCIVKLLSKNNNVNNEITDINLQSIDQRRTVFVSLIGLFQTYKQCPSYILYSSLLIIPLKHEWIYQPYKYQKELELHFVSDLSYFLQDKTEIDEFIEFLKWKDCQGFVFWTLDDYNDDDNKYNDHICNQYDNQLFIAPFWRYLSAKLSSLYDPITRNKYKPLQFDGKWWFKSFENKMFPKYNDKLSAILAELSLVTMKYKTMQEIIYQSNPQSLNVVIFYGQSNVEFVNDVSLLMCNDSDRNDDDDDDDNKSDLEEEKGWFISTDYDPYDL